MSVKAMTWAFALDLPCSAKFVLVCLADHASPEGICWPSIPRLAQRTGQSISSVQRAIRLLVKKGLLCRLGKAQLEGFSNVPVDLIPDGMPIYFLSAKAADDYPKAQRPTNQKSCPPALRGKCIIAFEMTCSYCSQTGDDKKGPDGHGWTIDRLVPGAKGGKYTYDNITLSCKSCNSKKGTKVEVFVPSLEDMLGTGQDDPPPQSQGDIGTGHSDPLTVSIEPSVEPSIASAIANVGKKTMKEFGSGDVEEVLKTSEKKVDVDMIIDITERNHKGLYPHPAIRTVWRSLWAENEYGFCADFTIKQKGQITNIQKKLEEHSILEVLRVIIPRWAEFTEETGSYTRPKRPDVYFIFWHVGVAATMYLETLQSVAPKEKMQYVP